MEILYFVSTVQNDSMTAYKLHQLDTLHLTWRY